MLKREQHQIIREAILRLDFHRSISLNTLAEQAVVDALIAFAGDLAYAEGLLLNEATYEAGNKATIQAHKTLKERTL